MSRRYPGLHAYDDEQCERIIQNVRTAELSDILRQVLAVEPSLGPWGVKATVHLGMNHWGSVEGATKVEFTARGTAFTYWIKLGERGFRERHLQKLMEDLAA